MLPDIYFFNPTCELAIANNSPYYTAPARLRKFEEDLAFLPAWLGREEDQVLVKGLADEAFSERMSRLGFKLAAPVNLVKALSDTEWMSRPRGRLVPWGWSPAVYQLFQPVFPLLNNQFKESAVAVWKTEHRQLYSRLTGIALLNRIISGAAYDWLPDPSAIPVVCDSMAAIFREIEKCEKAVVKTPWSSSGRGLLLFPNIDSSKKNEEVLSGMLKQQGFVTVEPWLQKVMDLSYQFQSVGGKIIYMGRTIFETDQKGRYLRNLLNDSPETSPEVSLFLKEHNDEVISLLSRFLAASNYSQQYEGWIGVDSLVYRTTEGILKFQPVVEINGRYTMGAIALKLRPLLAEGSAGFLQIFYSRSSNFHEFCQKKEAEKPLKMKDDKIASGFLPLTPPHSAHHFGAYIECINLEIGKCENVKIGIYTKP